MDRQGMTMFYDVCRLCLGKRGEHSMFGNEELPEDIFACTGVRVKSTDNLPQTICDKCLETITNAKELRKLATNNDTHLRMLFEEDINSDDEAGKLVIDESLDRSEEIETIQTILDEDGRPIDVSLTIERGLSPVPPSKKQKVIGIRKDLFATSSPNESPDSSSTLKNTSENAPRRDKKKVSKRKVLVVDGNKDITKRFEGNCDVEYQCTTCQKEFDTYKKLYLHQRLHNKTIACPDCPKKFATKGDLEKHRRVHTGEKPFACDVCDRRFTQKVTLKQHKEAVHLGIVPDDSD